MKIIELPARSAKLRSIMQKYGLPVAKGLVSQFAPGVLKGMIVEVLRQRKATVARLYEYVAEDASLWELIDPDHKVDIKALATYAGNLSWFTPDWLIQALANDFPELSSIFLSDPEVRAWLERQLKLVKEEAGLTS